MRILYALLVSVLLLIGFAAIPGCVSTSQVSQEQAFVIAGESRVLAIRTITELNDAGLIDPEDYEAIDAAIAITKTALELWEEALLEGGSTVEAENQFYEGFKDLRSYKELDIE